MAGESQLDRIERRIDAIWRLLAVLCVLAGAAILFGLVLPLFIDALGQDADSRLDEVEACIRLNDC